MIALIVEREWDAGESLKKKLQARGYEVHVAENAEEALNLCVVVDVDLVITSATLPEMTGLGLVERIAEGRRDLKISSIILVERDEDLSEILCRERKIQSVIRKPVTEEILDQCLGGDAMAFEQ